MGLELEAGCELHLTLTEQRAVSAGDVKERIGPGAVEGQRRSGLVVNRWINNRHLRAVENVEAFHQKLQLHTLSNAEASRKPRINPQSFCFASNQTHGVGMNGSGCS